MSWSQLRQQNIPKAKLCAKALKQKEADLRENQGRMQSVEKAMEEVS